MLKRVTWTGLVADIVMTLLTTLRNISTIHMSLQSRVCNIQFKNYTFSLKMKILILYWHFICADQIAINDFAAGAMENWGLITYREERLLWDPEVSTLYEKQRASGTIAHELLHQVTYLLIKYYVVDHIIRYS